MSGSVRQTGVHLYKDGRVKVYVRGQKPSTHIFDEISPKVAKHLLAYVDRYRSTTPAADVAATLILIMEHVASNCA